MTSADVKLEPLTIPNLRSSIEQQVRQAIIAGIFRPGQRVVESAIADQLGVSRTSVREVLSALDREGLIVSVPRRGYFVISFSDKDVEDVYDLRLILETAALRRSMERLTPEQIAEMQRIVNAIGEAAGRGANSYELGNLDMKFHEAICRASGNSRLCSTWNAMRWQTQLLVGLTAQTHYARPYEHQEYHQQILDAIVAGDSDRAEATLTFHITDSERRAHAALRNLQLSNAAAAARLVTRKKSS